MSWRQILFNVVSAAVVGAVTGLAFGWVGEIPWEDAKVDAGAFAIVSGGLVLFFGIRDRLRGSEP